MKRLKAVSLILAASMVLSLTGCSGRKKAIFEATDSYAQALISGDIDDLADLMEDDDKFEEEIERYMDRYAKNEDLEDLFDYILENTTYEIDKKSAAVTDKKAIIKITFTMPDYMCAYEDLDNDDDADDFLDALEDAEDETVTFSQKIEFKLVKDEWKIVDDDFENTLEFYEFYQEISDLGFGKLKPYTCDEIEDILRDVLDADSRDFDRYGSGSSDSLYYYGNSIMLQAFEFDEDDIDDAAEEFEDLYDEFVDGIEDEGFDGNVSYDIGDGYGYVLLDGTIRSEYYDEHVYGGIYWAENTMLIVSTEGDSSSSREDVDALLNALGYPTP